MLIQQDDPYNCFYFPQSEKAEGKSGEKKGRSALGFKMNDARVKLVPELPTLSGGHETFHVVTVLKQVDCLIIWS